MPAQPGWKMQRIISISSRIKSNAVWRERRHECESAKQKRQAPHGTCLFVNCERKLLRSLGLLLARFLRWFHFFRGRGFGGWLFRLFGGFWLRSGNFHD